MNKREFIESWFQRVWFEEDFDAIDEMLLPSVHVEGLRETPQVGPQEFRQFAEAFLGRIKDMRVGIAHYMESGDWASALVTISAACRATGKPVSTTGQVLVRIKNDVNVEAYNHIDFITLYEELGLMPHGTHSHCLSGGSLSFD